MLAAERATESPAPEHGSAAIDREPVVAKGEGEGGGGGGRGSRRRKGRGGWGGSGAERVVPSPKFQQDDL